MNYFVYILKSKSPTSLRSGN